MLASIAHRLQANSVNLDIKRVVAYRHWCNKLWNAVRFALMNLGEGFRPCASPPQPSSLPMACQWILSRLNAATEGTVSALETYAFSAASQVCTSGALLALGVGLLGWVQTKHLRPGPWPSSVPSAYWYLCAAS